jgi:predicted aldo/keto reductase-like oxidoreductase
MDVLLEAVKTGVFETIQYPHNSIETSCEEELIPAARAAGIGRIGMKPAGGGALEDVPLSIRFILTRGTDAVIPGVESVDQLRRNIAAAAPLIHPDRNEMEFLEREAEELGPTFCRRCGYCLPCPNGLNIPFLLLLPVYYKRYKLEEWAAERVRALDVVFDDCDRCGICETRCPYGLPIMDMLSEGNTLFSNLEKK